jgi:SAM-dependent methyltransferase
VSGPWESTEERLHFRTTFDEDAEAYDRSRPVCPPQVFDDVVVLAGLGRGSKVVEIGPGTGQATRPLAERGIDVLGLELGPAMADRARRNLVVLPGVEIVTTTFEAWDAGGRRFDAVFSCNAFHWIDPELRFAKSAAMLRPGGHLVLVSTPWVVPTDAERFWWDVQDDFFAVGAEREDPATKHPDLARDSSASLVRSGLFHDPIQRRYPFDVEFTADAYVDNLSTQSGMKRFEPDARRELFRRVHDRITGNGGTVRAHLLALLTIAEVR